MGQDYFYGQQSEMFAFIRVPKALFKESCYRGMSTEARTLYGLLLDRMNLSAKNGWKDKKGRIYIIFTIKEIMEDLGYANQKVLKLLDELEHKYDLIERKRQGQGKPNIIYVKQFLPPQNHENHDSKNVKNTFQEACKSLPNNTNKNNTDMSKTLSYQSPLTDSTEADAKEIVQIDEMDKRRKARDYFLRKIEFNILLHDHPNDAGMLEGILTLLVDTVCTDKQTIRVCQEEKPREAVIETLKKLDKSHIEYLLLSFSRNTTNVGNIKQYLLTALYNAPSTIDAYYEALVNHNMAQT